MLSTDLASPQHRPSGPRGPRSLSELHRLLGDSSLWSAGLARRPQLTWPVWRPCTGGGADSRADCSWMGPARDGGQKGWCPSQPGCPPCWSTQAPASQEQGPARLLRSPGEGPWDRQEGAQPPAPDQTQMVLIAAASSVTNKPAQGSRPFISSVLRPFLLKPLCCGQVCGGLARVALAFSDLGQLSQEGRLWGGAPEE